MDFNIETIIQAPFTTDTITYLIKKKIPENTTITSNKTILEFPLTRKEIQFNLTIEASYSQIAWEDGIKLKFLNFQKLDSQEKPDKVECIEMALELIQDFLILEFHAQEGEYVPQLDY